LEISSPQLRAGQEVLIVKIKSSENKFAFLFPVGLGIGTALGALIHNVGLGLAIGACIGTIASLVGWYLSGEQAN
jgi:hypothetical protein